MEIKQMNTNDVITYERELTEFLYMVLSENVTQEVTFDLAKKYYSDLKLFTEDGTAIVIGAFSKEKLVGFHWGYEVNILNERRMHSYLNAIDYDYRGQKIGTKFFSKLEEITIERGIRIIEAMVTFSNHGAMQYHIKNGFEIERVKVKKQLNLSMED